MTQALRSRYAGVRGMRVGDATPTRNMRAMLRMLHKRGEYPATAEAWAEVVRAAIAERRTGPQAHLWTAEVERDTLRAAGWLYAEVAREVAEEIAAAV